jgi:hypothetical protein
MLFILGIALLAAGCYTVTVQTLTIKLERDQQVWLEEQARSLKRSKGAVIRDLIKQQQLDATGSLGQALADLRGCLQGSKKLSTRPLNGYGRD